MIDLPVLDDRTFADFVSEARATIPTLAPGWTDHNPTDPGIILVELFAWLAEIVLYRIDRVPDRSYYTFLTLLRGSVPTNSAGEPLAVPEATRTTIGELRDRYRAVTPDDFEYLATTRWPKTSEAVALGNYGRLVRAACRLDPTDGVFTLVVVPTCSADGVTSLAAFADDRRLALELDGAAGYADAGADTTFQITGPLTLSVWIFPRSLGQRRGLICKDANGEFELFVEPDGAIGFHQADGVDGGTSAGSKIALGRWTHVAIVRDGTSLTFYFDGVVVQQSTLVTPADHVPVTTSHVVIGRLAAGGGFFDGFIRDVCIWNSARSTVDLGGDARLAPAAAGGDLVASWPFVTNIVPPGIQLLPAPPAQGVSWRDVFRPLELSAPTSTGVAALLDEWRLLTARVKVVSQVPLKLKIVGKLYLRSDGVPQAVRAAAAHTLDAFLDPLNGWRGAGWPFGRPVYSNDLAAALDGLVGVDYSQDVVVSIQPGAPARPDPTNEDGISIGVSLLPTELPNLDQVELQLFQWKDNTWQPA